jgi:ABC-type dipeptide/oligopeptide/nickel transport system permease subunit
MVFRSRVFTEPLALVGLALVVLVVVAALGADVFARHDPIALDIRHRLQPPDWILYRAPTNSGDVFARVLYGARIALWVSIVSVGAALALGSVLGVGAGYGPRWLDDALILVFDAVRSFPTVLFALALVALIGPSLGPHRPHSDAVAEGDRVHRGAKNDWGWMAAHSRATHATEHDRTPPDSGQHGCSGRHYHRIGS